MKLKSSLLYFLIGLMFVYSCKKEDEITDSFPINSTPATSYKVPSTYNAFVNVDYSEATILIGMMGALSAEIAKGTGDAGATVPVALDGGKLKNMLSNSGNPFGDLSYDSSGYQIKGNCIAVSHPETESYIDSLVMVSQTNAKAGNGVAGLGTTLTSRRLLLTASGINYSQILFKTLMGDLIAYQITKRVLDNSLDNTLKIGGKGYTAMEHNWDVAFGYWGVPDSFPSVKSPVKYWGSYSNQVDGGLGCNAEVMNAFLKGRAAISNKDMSTKNAQALIIVKAFDKMTAAAVIRELKEADLDIAANDMVQLVNHLSEAKAFAMAMKNNKNAGRVITDTQIETLLAFFPENLWDATLADLTNIKTFIATVYGFTPTQLAKM
jgi:hypothetical protein